MRLARSQADVWKVCAFIALGQLVGNVARFDRNWRKAKQRGV